MLVTCYVHVSDTFHSFFFDVKVLKSLVFTVCLRSIVLAIVSCKLVSAGTDGLKM